MVFPIKLGKNEKYFASGSDDVTIKLWGVNKHKQIRTFLGHSGLVDSLVFIKNEKIFVSGSVDKSIIFWCPASGRKIYFLDQDKDIQ